MSTVANLYNIVKPHQSSALRSPRTADQDALQTQAAGLPPIDTYEDRRRLEEQQRKEKKEEEKRKAKEAKEAEKLRLKQREEEKRKARTKTKRQAFNFEQVRNILIIRCWGS